MSQTTWLRNAAWIVASDLAARHPAWLRDADPVFGGNTVPRYRHAGVALGLGTDVSPHNVIEDMRLAAILARIAAQDISATSTAEIFHPATVGGARALGRDGIGRQCPGMRADIVPVDVTTAQAGMRHAVPPHDWARRIADETVPLSTPTMTG